MKKNSLQSYKVQYRLKAELKTTNQIPISPLRMSNLVVVHCKTNYNQEHPKLKVTMILYVFPNRFLERN